MSRAEALLIDFGGVLTTDVYASFREACVRAGGPADAIELAFREDPEAGRLLVERECGRMSERDFEERFARLLQGRGVAVRAEGLIAELTAGLRPDEAMLAAVRALRAAGVPVAIVSNAMDEASYDGYALDELADAVVLSTEVGVRKPSRRIYALSAARLSADPAACVLVDDLQQNLDGAARLGVRGVLHREAARTIAALEELFGVDLSPAAAVPSQAAGRSRRQPG